MSDGYTGTLARCYWPLMMGPTVRKSYCVVCGRPASDNHHVVWRSWGELHNPWGVRMKKPTLTLCGHGNTGGCHGLAHSRRLHFRYVEVVTETDFRDRGKDDYGKTKGGHWEFALFDEPTDYLRAIEEGDWRRIH